MIFAVLATVIRLNRIVWLKSLSKNFRIGYKDAMKYINPKNHDAIFKWLITAFTREFFSHYFPGIRIGNYRFIDKEFISRYEALKESLKGDLFLLAEIEVESEVRELAIQIEHQSSKEDVGERLFEYLCYVWLLKKKPVWSIVIYTDDATWKKQLTDKFWYAFDSGNRKQFFKFDVIKLRAEKSGELIRQDSLLCKLLSLKADDSGIDPETLLYEIYRTASEKKNELTPDQLLFINRWAELYRKVSDHTFDRIRKEFQMDTIETTISEHIYNQGKFEGILQGKTEGILQGKTEGILQGEIRGRIAMLEELHRQRMLSEKKLEKMLIPLRQKLLELSAKNN